MAKSLPWSPHREFGISHWQLEVKYTHRNRIEELSSARTIERVQLIAIACPRFIEQCKRAPRVPAKTVWVNHDALARSWSCPIVRPISNIEHANLHGSEVPIADAFTSNRLLRPLVRKESYHSPQPDRFAEIWSAASLDGRSDCVQTMQARKSER
jgi:hypothetical protein